MSYLKVYETGSWLKAELPHPVYVAFSAIHYALAVISLVFIGINEPTYILQKRKYDEKHKLVSSCQWKPT